uniref:WRKY domain-containing protein n=1 Tax=Kalanchoe fedtschenkoi TaxID=63787 RepID=A0A7N0V7R0_KALFE
MENWEQQTLINELTQGMELAKQLRFHVGPSSTTETREYLVQKILSSYDKALLILNWSKSASNGQGTRPQPNVASNLLPESPCSFDGSPRSEPCDKGIKDQLQQQEHLTDLSKKRKPQAKWTDHVRIYCESGLEGPHDDGFSWRKYGQKDILGARYPRSYYRCTNRNIKHCWATKQVQRSDEDPTVFEITYKGKHTCLPECDPNLEPTQQDGEVQRLNNNANDHKQSQADDFLQNLKNNLKVNTEDMSNKEMPCHLPLTSASTEITMNGNYSPANFDGSLMQIFTSPAMSASNSLPVSPFRQYSSFGRGFGTVCCSESDRSDMFSSNANSPYLDLDFTPDPADPDLTFPFNVPGFFP